VTRKRDDGSESEGDGSFLKRLGPGLITGASDDDPSGIGTCSQAGAQLGFGVGWIMPDLPADGRDPRKSPDGSAASWVMASLETSAEISGAGGPIVKDLGISSNWFFAAFSASPVKFGGDWSPVGVCLTLNTGHWRMARDREMKRGRQ
jgi:hypothetical protein